METLRRSLFLLAAILLVIAVLTELGSSAIRGELDPGSFRSQALQQLGDVEDKEELVEEMLEDLKEGTDTKPPGIGIPYLALLDGLLLYVIGLIGMGLLVPERVHGRIQGVVTLIVSFLVLLFAISKIISAFIKLLIMVALLTSPPFGTIAYLAMYGFFNRPSSNAVLSAVMLLKLCFAGVLVFAHQRFLQNKGLVLFILISLLATILVGFLHGLVPLFLVSITDAVAALIIGVIAAIFAILLLILSIVAIIRAIV